MPLPRKLSPRRRERRSRSRSPRNRRRSRSRSRSRDRRRSRSRSAQRRRSPERKRSPVRRRSPSPRKRSRSPRRRSHSSRRSRSHSPRRRSRSHSPRRGSPPRRRSTSPADKIYPVKRPADSSVKRQSYRSRSRSESPAPVKKSRDERLYREESPHEKQRPSRRSTSPSYRSPYSGKMYADNPPSSRQPLFPAGTSKRAAAEIDYVTIVEKGPKKEKLNKRFETLEQAARGPFDFEENITIGIHRGPQHIQLDGDEDIEVNYDFNPKTFKMLFPKKDYVKAIFDRDEIKAFHHDDILDEEAYVEKRTISIKPVDKPKSRKYNEEMDYKITVGTGREGYGDRRMVHDSGSRQRPSRSSGYEDIPVTVRLDPKPDPRYEKMYREQQRFEDHALMHEKVNRDPNDLRYNLMRRRSDGDRERGHDSRDAPSGAMDARSRIEARRQESRDYGDRRDRPDVRRGTRVSPQRSADRKKTTFVKTDLPDFKNRPGGSGFVSHDNRHGDVRSKWGHCSICNIPLSSEQHALDHVNSEQHQANEDAQRYRSSPARQIRCRDGRERGESSRRDHLARVYVDESADRKRHLSTDSDFDPRDRKRRSISKEFERISDDELDKQMFSGSTEQYPEHDVMRSPASELDDTGSIKTRIVWIIGTEEIKSLQQYSVDCENYGPNFGLGRFNISLVWKCERGLRMRDVLPIVSKMKIEETKPNCIVLHVGGNDLEKMSKLDFKGVAIDMIDSLKQQFPGAKLVWSQLLPRSRGLNATRVAIDDEIASYVLEGNGHYIRYPEIEVTDNKVFKMSKSGELDLTTEGILKMMPVLKGGLVSIMNRNISIVPILKNLPRKVSLFVYKNYGTKFANRKPFYKKKAPFYMKKVPFFRR